MTLARVLIARYKSDRGTGSIHEITGLLERLLQAAKAEKRFSSVIEILVLLALAHAAQGDIPLALVSLERALTLAEPEGYVRIFLDEGKPMAELLKRAGKTKSSFLEKQAISPQPLIEPLSENELEVLRLLKTELSGPEIARERMVSLSTIRTHTQHIYAKLGVNNRRAAVRRAEELGLL